jgi:hypothetical protein
MCDGDMSAFAQKHSVSPRQAAMLLVTAEHLVARRDGGTNANSNIAAAHHWCNQMRHHRKARHTAESFRKLVSGRLAAGKWFDRSLVGRLTQVSA